ncbi:MAG: ribonuclease P protein component [Chthonomonas sp.]|nr:ribonuclease P protein component [Chthonomonas sp.]
MLAGGPKKSRFQQIFEEGLIESQSALKVACLPGSGLLGITTAKAIGSKPQRNRLKRRIREAIRPSFDQRHKTFDWIVTGTRKAENSSLLDLVAAWQVSSDRLIERWEKGSS